MKAQVTCTILALMVSLWLSAAGLPGGACLAAEAGQRMLAHDVYFSLKDNSAEAKKNLVAGCKRFLSDHPGTVWFAAGTLVAAHDREVNDRDFDVALHIVFQDKASHDKYQQAEGHHKFIEQFKDNWQAVRVFDSWLDTSSRGGIPDRPERAGKATSRK